MPAPVFLRIALGALGRGRALSAALRPAALQKTLGSRAFAAIGLVGGGGGRDRPSAAVVAAQARRAARGNVSVKWFDKEVIGKVNLTNRQRMRVATEFLKSTVVKNISKPVGKTGSPVRITERSKPGEFPRADTTQLMKTIFGEVVTVGKNVHDGIIGTPLDYGLILETRRDRSFLKRTLDENRTTVTKILTKPIK